jgi:hypothetical protein
VTAEGPGGAARRVRVPWTQGSAEIGLGDVMRRLTSALRIPDCPGCGRRAERLNRLVSFGSDAAPDHSEDMSEPPAVEPAPAAPGDRPIADRPPPRPVPTVDVAELDRVYRAVAQAGRIGALEFGHSGLIAEVGWIDVLLGELATLADYAHAVTAGDPSSLEGLRLLLADAPRLSLSRPLPEPPGDGLPCPVRPLPSPLVFSAAGALLGRFAGEDAAPWVERVHGYAIARLARVQGIVAAAGHVDRRRASVTEFAAAFEALRPPMPDHGGNDVPPVEPHDASSVHGHEGPDVAGDAAHMPPPLGIPSRERWDPCSLAWGHCAGVTGRGALERDAVPAVGIGRVAPGAVCSSATGRSVRLAPVADRFPARPEPGAGGFMLDLDGHLFPLEVTSWSDDEVKVALPDGIPIGCGTVAWRGADIVGQLADRFERCARLFPVDALEPVVFGPFTRTHGVATLAVVGDPVVTFLADGRSSLSVAACAPVTLTWRADAGLCSSPPPRGDSDLSVNDDASATLAVTITTGDGETLVAGAAANGSVVVDAASSEMYTLATESRAEGTLCARTSATVTVNRQVALAAALVRERVFNEGDEVELAVSIPCRAPAGGLQVQLTSSSPGIVPSGTIKIAAGATSALATLPVTGPSGRVVVTVSAPGHTAASVTFPVHTSACLPASFGLPRERYGGSWTRPVSVRGVVGVHLAVLHTGEVLLFSYDEGSGARTGGAALLACLRTLLPSLAACDVAWGSSRAACETAYAARTATCRAVFSCATAADCDAFWWTDPRRYVCHAGRLLCEAARAVCLAGAEIARFACHAAAWVSMAACKVSTVGSSAACVLSGVTVSTAGDLIRILVGGSSLPSDDTALTIGRSDRAACALWNPATNGVTPVSLPRNLFCSGHAFLGDGRLFVASGQFPAHLLDGAPVLSAAYGRGAAHDVHVFDPAARSWTRLADMPDGRWYPTVVALDDGRAVVMSGNGEFFAGPGGTKNSLQVFAPLSATPPSNGGRPVEPFAPTGALEYFYHLYPFAHVLPSREVFIHWKRRTARYRAGSGPGTWEWHWQGPLYGQKTWKETVRPVSRTGPGPGTSVLLPLRPTRDESGGIRYPAGKVMIIGGGGREGESDPEVLSDKPYVDENTPATNTSEILDFDEPDYWGNPDWRWTGRKKDAPSFMRHARVMPDPVLLPDGTLLVVNGARIGRSGGFLIHVGAGLGAQSAVLEPECFDPETETWQEFCPKPLQRFYHATAALLPDGRVVVAGHDGFLNRPGQPSIYELEVFSPPYLERGARPVIGQAPTALGYGGSFSVQVRDAPGISAAALIRQSSITHQTNTDQRYVGLTLLGGDSQHLVLNAPPHGGVAPPGYYMLFLLSNVGVPSMAHWIKVG